MNKTKKLTTGAMMLAIIGALMAIDRQLSFLFEELIILCAPIVIIMYSTMYTLKDGAILSFGLLVISFLFGSTSAYVYIPLAIIVGIGYSFGITKNLDRTKLTLIAIVLYVVGEVLITFIFMPLLGIDIETQVLEISTLLQQTGLMADMDTLIGDVHLLIIVIFVFSILFVGVLEGYLTGLLSVFFLKRFKIRNIGTGNLFEIKANPPVAYIGIAFTALIFINLQSFVSSDIVICILYCLAFAGAMVLAFYGYMYLIINSRLQSGKNVAPIIIIGFILLFPISLFTLDVVGFMYAAGPLANKLERIRDEIQR